MHGEFVVKCLEGALTITLTLFYSKEKEEVAKKISRFLMAQGLSASVSFSITEIQRLGLNDLADLFFAFLTLARRYEPPSRMERRKTDALDAGEGVKAQSFTFTFRKGGSPRADSSK